MATATTATLTDPRGNTLYPVTRTDLIHTSEGLSLDAKIAEVSTDLQEYVRNTIGYPAFQTTEVILGTTVIPEGAQTITYTATKNCIVWVSMHITSFTDKATGEYTASIDGIVCNEKLASRGACDFFFTCNYPLAAGQVLTLQCYSETTSSYRVIATKMGTT